MWSKEGIIVLIVFTVANLFTYFTRYMPSATKDLIKEDLNLTDFQTGLIFTVFICSYMVVSPLVGLLSSHNVLKRKTLCAIGMLLLSAATFVTGLCKSFGTIIIPRILFGVGEATYCAISTPLLSDFFAPQQRSLVMSIFFAAIPIGCAIGYTVVGSVAQAVGWRRAFMYLCTPGILAIGLLFLREPVPGEQDRDNTANKDKKRQKHEHTELGEERRADDEVASMHDISAYNRRHEKEEEEEEEQVGGDDDESSNSSSSSKRGNHRKGVLIDDYDSPSILNARWVVAVGGYIAVTFGMGGFSDWLPTLFVRVHGMSLSQAGTLIGAIIVIGGLLGTLGGGFLGDFVKNHVTRRHPYMLFSGVTMLISAVFSVLTLVACQDKLVVVELFLGLGIFFGWCYNGPLNAVLLNCVEPQVRALSNGLCMLLIHLFGDAISPSIIGWVSDSNDGDLTDALLLVPGSIAISGAVWLLGWLTLPSSSRYPCCPTLGFAPDNTSTTAPDADAASTATTSSTLQGLEGGGDGMYRSSSSKNATGTESTPILASPSPC